MSAGVISEAQPRRREVMALGVGAALLCLLVLARLQPYLSGDAHPVLFAHLTLSRLVASLLAGAGLGMAGAVLQGLTRNPLASPGLLGVTAGAHLAIVLAILLGGGRFPLIAAAFLGSVAAMALTWAIAGRAGREGAALALAGVAVNLCLTAFATALTLLDGQQMAGAFLWSAGASVEAGWAPVWRLVPWLCLGLAAALTLSRTLDVMALGSGMARSLGLGVGVMTAAGFLVTGLAGGAAVALAGPVAFVGLVAPNALRRLGVYRHRWLLPLSALWGAALLGVADWLADLGSRLGDEIPVGVVTAILGAPVFIWLLRRVGATDTGDAAAPAVMAGRRTAAGMLPAGLAAVALLAVTLGETNYTPSQLWSVVTGEAPPAMAMIVWELRVPRLLVAMAAGALLALAGQLLQAVLSNPLAGPETLGLVQGAALSAMLALVAGAPPGGPLMQAAALAGALVALAVVLGVAGDRRLSPSHMVLGGIALASMLASLAALATLLAQLQATRALAWLTGSVYARGWPEVLAILPAAVAVSVAAWGLARRLDVSGLGEAKAASLGLDTGRARLLACSLAAAAAAAAVSVAGSVTFVGLLGPHLARMLSGGAFRVRLPAALACGAGLAAAADLAGRTLFTPIQLPLGVMTAVIGGPFFLWLMRRSWGDERG